MRFDKPPATTQVILTTEEREKLVDAAIILEDICDYMEENHYNGVYTRNGATDDFLCDLEELLIIANHVDELRNIAFLEE